MDVVPTNAGGVALPAHASHPHAALLFADFLLSPEGQKFLGKFGLDSAVHKPDFKRWYAEAGMTVEQYEKVNSQWEKLLREIGVESNFFPLMARARYASTVVLLRPDEDGSFEILLTRRPPEMRFLGGFYVFPGGSYP